MLRRRTYRAAEQIIEALPRDHLTGIVVARARDLVAAVPVRHHRMPAVRELRELVAASGLPAAQ